MSSRDDVPAVPPHRAAWTELAWAAGIMLASLVTYAPALHGEKLWDDDVWMEGLRPLAGSLGGLLRLWTDPQVLQQYYPVTGTSFWLDLRLWGDAMFPRHVENVLLHALSALLLRRLLDRLSVPGARLAAALFAMHPVMAESVAWISERKNVLSLPLCLGSLLVYARFRPSWAGGGMDGKPGNAWAYGGALVLFVAALLAKITAFSLPAVILVIGWWKQGAVRWRRDVLPVLPMLAITAGVGWLVLWLEEHHAGAAGEDWRLAFAERCVIAGRAWWFYLEKLVWPVDLRPVYPRWSPAVASWFQWMPLAGVVAAGSLLTALRSRIGRGPLTAFLLYSGTMLPVLGFLNVYGMLYTFVADRWVYLPAVVPLAVLGVTGAKLAQFARWRAAAPLLGSAVLTTLAGMTWRQAGVYRNSETLWRAALAGNPGCWVACNNLAGELVKQGRAAEAVPLYERSVALRPRYADAHANLGLVLLSEGRSADALAHFQSALEVRPAQADYHVDAGNALLRLGRTTEAIAGYRRALELNPGYAEALVNLGNALLQSGEATAAAQCYRKTQELQPDSPFAHHGLGMLALQAGDVPQAVRHFQRAVELKPDYADAHNSLGNAFFQQRRLDDALACYRQAAALQARFPEALYNLANTHLELGQMMEARRGYEQVVTMQPENVAALNNLAWVLATAPESSVRDGAKAVETAQRADQLTGGSHAIVLHTLAAAFAEAGRFDDAVRAAEKALAISEGQGNTPMSAAIREQLAHYSRREPYRDPRGRATE